MDLSSFTGRSLFWARMEEFPPWFVRVLARKPRVPRSTHVDALSDQEIARVSGLAEERVRVLSYFDSWDGLTFAEAKRFLHGCRFDPTCHADRNRNLSYLRQLEAGKSDYSYLRRSPYWEGTFRPLLREKLGDG